MNYSYNNVANYLEFELSNLIFIAINPSPSASNCVSARSRRLKD